jgi:hypothetical protein
MPVGAKPLTVQMQDYKPHIWMLVDPDAEKVDRRIYMIGTGHGIEEDRSGEYVDSIQLEQGRYVFHIFAGKEG